MAKKRTVKHAEAKQELAQTGESKEPRALESGNKALIVFGVLIVIAVVLIFGVKKFYQPHAQTIDDLFQKTYKGDVSDTNFIYNGLAFVKSDGLWYTELQKKGTNQAYLLPLHFSPKELQNIYLVGSPSTFNRQLARTKDPENANQTAAYIVFDPLGPDLNYVALASGELSLSLAQALNVLPIAACTQNGSDACANRPILNCETDPEAMIYMTYENRTRVAIANNCIIVSGKNGTEMLRATERLIYAFYGIMPIEQRQFTITAFAERKNGSVQVAPGFYDAVNQCSWVPGELTVDVLDSDNNIIATRKANITSDDKFLEYCTTKQPIIIPMSADQLNAARRINAKFMNIKGDTLTLKELVNIK